MNGYMDDRLSSWQCGGFAWHARRNRRRCTLHAIAVVPFWSLAAVTAALPLAWTMRRLRARRARTAGLCPACGYDLRATPERCPECRRLPAATPATAA